MEKIVKEPIQPPVPHTPEIKPEPQPPVTKPAVPEIKPGHDPLPPARPNELPKTQ